jgi:hypothetical protein
MDLLCNDDGFLMNRSTMKRKTNQKKCSNSEKENREKWELFLSEV